MTTAEKMTALESLIYAYCRSQFHANDMPPDEARIVMECVLSKFRWNCIDASTLGKMLTAPPGTSGTPEELRTGERTRERARDAGLVAGTDCGEEVNADVDHTD